MRYLTYLGTLGSKSGIRKGSGKGSGRGEYPYPDGLIGGFLFLFLFLLLLLGCLRLVLVLVFDGVIGVLV